MFGFGRFDYRRRSARRRIGSLLNGRGGVAPTDSALSGPALEPSAPCGRDGATGRSKEHPSSDGLWRRIKVPAPRRDLTQGRRSMSMTRKRKAGPSNPVVRHGRRPVMNRLRAIGLLRQSKSTLSSRYGVTRLALFGSTARDEAREGSDVDVLVAFEGPASSQQYFGVQFYLEDLFGRPVDLVTEKALRPELRPSVEKEAVRVSRYGPWVALLSRRHGQVRREGRRLRQGLRSGQVRGKQRLRRRSCNDRRTASWAHAANRQNPSPACGRGGPAKPAG
jgi:predicted nucleotidyltransferase